MCSDWSAKCLNYLPDPLGQLARNMCGVEIEEQKTLTKPKIYSTVQQAGALPFLRHIWICRPLHVEYCDHTNSVIW